MDSFDLSYWVDKKENYSDIAFRQAVHTLIHAISTSELLRSNMIFHGGLLIAIRFDGIRYTKDIDFVTGGRRKDFNEEQFISSLNEELSISCESLKYNLDCKVQSFEFRPPGKDRSFPTLKMKMGYAYKGTSSHRRLLKGNCSTVIEIDYSFNEQNKKIDLIRLVSGGEIKAYSLPDLVAEKYRSIIQQKIRKRTRRQDAFDIYWLIKSGYLDDNNLKVSIYDSLILKSNSRNLEVTKDSLSDEEVISCSKKDYETLAVEINDDLPSFDDVYKLINLYYMSLPWPE